MMRAFLCLTLIAAAAAGADGVPWRTDYQTGRKEASDTGKAVCLVISSENCFYCKKLEATTMADAAVASVLRQSFVGIKVEAAKEQELVKILKIQLFPTTVLAGPDGTIHAIINGYVSADQMRDSLRKALAAITDEEKAGRDVALAGKAIEAGDIAKAVAMLRPIADGKGNATQILAKELLDKAEKIASTRAVVQAVRPQALLDVAKQLHDASRYADSIDVAAEVARSHPASTEAKAAMALIASIRGDAEKLKLASRQADEKAAALQLALSESLLKSGDVAGAKTALDSVVRLCPNSVHAEAATAHLAKMKGPLMVTPATLKK